MPALNLLVFRDGQTKVCGCTLKNALAQNFRSLGNPDPTNKILSMLLRAGELECALADAAALGCCQEITDSLAQTLISPETVPDVNSLLAILDVTHVPEELSISAPEGFAYYALHPLKFADVLDQLSPLSARTAVVGIRSIGTTLSAVTVAGLRKRGLHAERITVRPVDHPYNRRAELTAEQMNFVKKEISSGASFLVVDEGPGLSGSSFLSVAEALLQAGVSNDKIALICSRAPEIDQLCAQDAARRWQQFRWLAVSSHPRCPEGARVWIGGGAWRRYLLPQTPPSCWPASWLSLERLKFLSGETTEPRFYKFLGFGHYGEQVVQREEQVSAVGFGAPPQIEQEGFASYPFLDGCPMSAGDVSESVLARLAAYCAFRANAFAVEAVELAPLQQMTEHNLQQLQLDVPVTLRLERPVIVDGRMQPHEWLLTRQGQMLKTDSGSHGDDHFFPGPADIAWDLAGAIVEWQMDHAETKCFLEMYRRASGDSAESRTADYVKAYAAFRCAYCMMAANAMRGSEEAQRLELASAAYRAALPIASKAA